MPKVYKIKIGKSKYEYLLTTTPSDWEHPDLLSWGIYDTREKQWDFLVEREHLTGGNHYA